MKKFAAFDIDGTFIRWQLFHAIVHHLGKSGFISAQRHNDIRAARMTWKNRGGEDAFASYEAILVDVYLESLKNIPPADYLAVVDAVFDEYKDQLFVYTRTLLKKLKSDGYVLFAISGSQDEIVQRLAYYHGFDAAVGATLEKRNGHFTGAIETPIHDKAAALAALVKAHGVSYDGSIAVGDSGGDIAMLSAVERPIAFNPEQKLFKHARQHGWHIAVERKNVIYELEPSAYGYDLKMSDELL